MNGFSSEWNGIYKDGMQLTSWPWSDLVSLLYSHCKDSIRSNGVVLELGCGAGPNIPFIQSLGMEYYGIDGSTEVVDILRDKFPNLKGKAVVGDFTDIECCIDLPSPDIIIDRAAVTHNNLSAIKHTLENSFNLLKVLLLKISCNSLTLVLNNSFFFSFSMFIEIIPSMYSKRSSNVTPSFSV